MKEACRRCTWSGNGRDVVYFHSMIAKPENIIEGTWEEDSSRSEELAGKRVRVVVLEEASGATGEAASKRPSSMSSDEEQAELRKRADAWLKETEKLVREPSKNP